MQMTEEEARAAIYKCGWSPRVRFLKKHTRRYLYAYRKRHNIQKEVYVWPMHKLESLTEAKIVEKLGSPGATAES